MSVVAVANHICNMEDQMSDTNALIDALRPFAALLEEMEGDAPHHVGDDLAVYVQPVGGTVQKLRIRDFRRARAALAQASKVKR